MLRQVDTEIQNLKDLILEMGGHAEKALEEACGILLRRNLSGVDRVQIQEKRINIMHLQVDQSCLQILAKQAPVAKDLRFVMSVIKINADLERMGDQAQNVSYNAADLLKRGGPLYFLEDFERMAAAVRDMVKMSLDAFVRRDVQLSQKVLERDDMVDSLKDKLFSELKSMIAKDSTQIDVCLDLILIARNLERTADHATNIAEEVVFITTGDDIRHGQRNPVGY